MIQFCEQGRGCCFAWAFFLCMVTATTAGPDDNELAPCNVFQRAVDNDKQQALGAFVQGIQSIDAQLGALQLGQSYPSTTASPNEDALKFSKETMSVHLRALLDVARIPSLLSLSLEAAEALAMACLSSRLQPGRYGGRPMVSILLNYFKRPQVVRLIAKHLRAACLSVSMPCELVVNVDNPHEAAAWVAEAGFVVPVFSANLHEARGYNRAAKAARGKYLVIWQDDQIPPTDGTWMLQMRRLFETYPRLGILGMNTYRMCRQMERGNRWGPAGWDTDPRTGIAWTYVHFTDFAPMAVVAAAFEELGGLEEGYSQRGECGITGDWELCARAWVGGWQVGYFSWEGRYGDPVEGGSTHKPNAAEACWGRQMEVGGRTFTKRYIHPVFVQEMCERVWAHNMLVFTLSSPDRCPYGNNSGGYANCSAPVEHEQRLELAARMHVALPPFDGFSG